MTLRPTVEASREIEIKSHHCSTAATRFFAFSVLWSMSVELWTTLRKTAFTGWKLSVSMVAVAFALVPMLTATLSKFTGDGCTLNFGFATNGEFPKTCFKGPRSHGYRNCFLSVQRILSLSKVLLLKTGRDEPPVDGEDSASTASWSSTFGFTALILGFDSSKLVASSCSNPRTGLFASLIVSAAGKWLCITPAAKRSNALTLGAIEVSSSSAPSTAALGSISALVRFEAHLCLIFGVYARSKNGECDLHDECTHTCTTCTGNHTTKVP